MTTWFEGLSLPVADLDRSVSCSVSLGFVPEIRNGRFVLLEAGGAVERLGAAASLVQVELGADDLDALYRDLLDRGIEVRVPPRDRDSELTPRSGSRGPAR